MDIHITDLRPPMMVSGTTSKHESDSPLFAFENGLAVTLTNLTANGQSYYTYTVIMSDGQVHDVDSRDITSAIPYQPQHDTRVVDVRKSRAALVAAEVAEMSDDLYTLLTRAPLTYRDIRKWAGGDTRKKMLTSALKQLTDQARVVVDGSHLYWAMYEGRPTPADLAGQFVPRTEGEVSSS